MKTIIQINGKDVEITLTKEQVAQINKQKKLDASSCTLKDCIDYLGEDDQDVIDLKKLLNVLNLPKHITSMQSAVVIIKALNEKWIPNWKNSSGNKYFIWWDMSDFSCNCWYGWNSFSGVSARLCLKNRELAESLGKNKNTIEIFKDFMTLG